MRPIFVGIEYAGKTTLIKQLEQYYHRRGLSTHNDDHFTIPDKHLSPESSKLMVGFPADVKERMQRMQIHYHIEIIKKFEYPMVAGWHIEEAIYSKFYGNDPEHPYYPTYIYDFQRLYESAVIEAHLPDVVLIHVTASDEEVRRRMKADPHEFQVIREGDIGAIKERFDEEVAKSLFTHQHRKVDLDTTGKTPAQSLDELLLATERMITTAELAMRCMTFPDNEYQVRYEGGVRKMIPK